MFQAKKIRSNKIWSSLAPKKDLSPVHPQGIPLGMNSGSKLSPNQKLGISILFICQKVQSRKIWPNLAHK